MRQVWEFIWGIPTFIFFFVTVIFLMIMVGPSATEKVLRICEKARDRGY